MKQFFEDMLDAIEDYAYAAVEFAKGAGWLILALFRNFPKSMSAFSVALAVVATVFYIDSGSAPTIQQQIAHYNRPGGTVHWVMQENGENPSGFLDLDSYGNKKQEADFLAALRFCNADKDFPGCDKVIQAANTPDFGGL